MNSTESPSDRMLYRSTHQQLMMLGAAVLLLLMLFGCSSTKISDGNVQESETQQNAVNNDAANNDSANHDPANHEPVTIATTHQDTIESAVLKQQRHFSVRLPANYLSDSGLLANEPELNRIELSGNSDSYAVLYVLDASPFYLLDTYADSIDVVSRLEKYGDIPELIVVRVYSESWYGDVIERAESFNQFLQQELIPHINKNYRTRPINLILGHSYAAAFLSTEAFSKNSQFDLIGAISPIYPSTDYLAKVKTSMAARESNSLGEGEPAQLIVLQGDESEVDVDLLKSFLVHSRAQSKIQSQNEPQSKEKSSINLQQFHYYKMPQETHHSVLPPAVNHLLRNFFADFRLPNREQLLQANMTLTDIQQHLINRETRYGLQAKDSDLQSDVLSVAQIYLDAKKFEQAFPLWEFTQTRFKSYFLNQAAERFVEQNDNEAAIKVWQKMLEYFPQQPLAFYQLKQMYLSQEGLPEQSLQQAQQQAQLAAVYAKQLDSIVENIDESSARRELNEFAYLLLAKQQVQQATLIFIQLTQAFPASANAFDSLGEAYERQGKLADAHLAYQRAVALAESAQHVQLSTFKANLSRVQANLFINDKVTNG